MWKNNFKGIFENLKLKTFSCDVLQTEKKFGKLLKKPLIIFFL